MRERCAWAVRENMWAYHDDEWGVPVHDDTRHFEFLILEGAQAGLSWSTILDKREGYRRAFAGFDADEGRALHAGEDREGAARSGDRAQPPGSAQVFDADALRLIDEKVFVEHVGLVVDGTQ